MSSRIHCIILVDEEKSGQEGPDVSALRATPLGLAYALEASPAWQEMLQAVLVYRPLPKPILAILGVFDDAAKVRIAALQGLLHRTQNSVRYIDYAQAENDCEALAQKLLDQFGRTRIQQFHFIGIPRGGLIVLGMLSYLLGLKQAQLEGSPLPNATLVAVDDCSLTGSRLGRFLPRYRNHSIIFAHLYSHPELRASIEVKEPQILACLSAQDLHDHAPEQLGDQYLTWREFWWAHFEKPRYWIGRPEKLIFSWSEPDQAIWNPVTKELEAGWRIATPEDCLKNRIIEDAPSRLQVQPEGKGPLKPSAEVLFGKIEEQIIIAHTGTEVSFGLSGVAADMWQALVHNGSEEQAVSALLEEYDIDESALRADLHNFVMVLLKEGLLERHEPLE